MECDGITNYDLDLVGSVSSLAHDALRELCKLDIDPSTLYDELRCGLSFITLVFRASSSPIPSSLDIFLIRVDTPTPSTLFASIRRPHDLADTTCTCSFRVLWLCTTTNTPRPVTTPYSELPTPITKIDLAITTCTWCVGYFTRTWQTLLTRQDRLETGLNSPTSRL